MLNDFDKDTDRMEKELFVKNVKSNKSSEEENINREHL